MHAGKQIVSMQIYVKLDLKLSLNFTLDLNDVIITH
jgi:hypothetical protein